MSTYRQDSVERTCAICNSAILPDQWILDLFRGRGQIEWVHENCCRSAIETFLTKKRARSKEPENA
jgi:hypothetical protein